MGFDTGKMAKQLGKASPKHARHIDQDPVRVPPHKKPRRYRLEVRWEKVTKTVLEKEFSSKADMQAFRMRVEREIENRKKKPPQKYSYWWSDNWVDEHDFKMDAVESSAFKTEPVFAETMIDSQAPAAT